MEDKETINIKNINCIKCDWIGKEEDLKFFLEDERDLESGMDCCPNCKTDNYLINTKRLIRSSKD